MMEIDYAELEHFYILALRDVLLKEKIAKITSTEPITNRLTCEQIENQFVRGLITETERQRLLNGRI